MKKVLLGTSAIALAGAFATSANAAEWEVKVGGYMEMYTAYATSDVDGISGGDFDGVDVKNESEVHFIPSITLDNGLEIGANFQLEGLTSGDQIDESYMFIDGSFGTVLLGSENSAGYKMTYGAPSVWAGGPNSGSLTKFMPFSGGAVGAGGTTDFDGDGVADGVLTGDDVFRRTLGSTYLENEGNNDAMRITYFTPRFAGFKVGVSYARDALQDDNSQINTDSSDLSNIMDIGANYVNSFGAFDVAVSGRYGIATDSGNSAGDPEDEDPNVWAAGLNLGYAGFTIGGSYGKQTDAGAENGEVWDVGVSYETGPWGFSFTYIDGTNADDELYSTGLGGSSPDEELKQYVLAGSYQLAQGVSLQGFGAYVDFDEELSDDAAGSGNDVNGWVLGTTIAVSW